MPALQQYIHNDKDLMNRCDVKNKTTSLVTSVKPKTVALHARCPRTQFMHNKQTVLRTAGKMYAVPSPISWNESAGPTAKVSWVCKYYEDLSLYYSVVAVIFDTEHVQCG